MIKITIKITLHSEEMQDEENVSNYILKSSSLQFRGSFAPEQFFDDLIKTFDLNDGMIPMNIIPLT